MTTKIFKLSERENNAWVYQASYNTRAEALETIAKILKADENADPQDFKIEVEERVDEDATLKEAASVVEASLSIFMKKFEVFAMSGVVELTPQEKYPSYTALEVRRMLTTLDNFNTTLPEDFEVWFMIDHKSRIRLYMQKPTKENN